MRPAKAARAAAIVADTFRRKCAARSFNLPEKILNSEIFVLFCSEHFARPVRDARAALRDRTIKNIKLSG